MSSETYDIQQLVTASGTPRRTIYFYVQQGLLLPPNGAGLAAHYTEDHLLRLRLIPVLRARGMRLDEIRGRFTQMSSADMQATLRESANRVPANRPIPAPMIPNQVIPEPRSWGEQAFTHYQLPAGISLVAPASLDSADRQRLTLLLQAARQIFAGSNPPFVMLDAAHSEAAHSEPPHPNPKNDSTDDGKPFSAEEDWNHA